MTGADQPDIIPDLAKLVRAALAGRHDAYAYGGRVASALQIAEDDTDAEAEARLRKGLGLASTGLAGRVAEILADVGYTDARIVFPGGFLVTEGPGYATTGWVVVSVPWADGTDAERRRILAAFAAALRDGGLEVAVRARYLNVRTQPGEARDDA